MENWELFFFFYVGVKGVHIYSSYNRKLLLNKLYCWYRISWFGYEDYHTLKEWFLCRYLFLIDWWALGVCSGLLFQKPDTIHCVSQVFSWATECCQTSSLFSFRFFFLRGMKVGGTSYTYVLLLKCVSADSLSYSCSEYGNESFLKKKKKKRQ